MRWSLSWLLNISQVFSGEWRLAMACIAWPSLSVSPTWSGRSFTFTPNASNQAFFPAGRNAPRRHRRETRGQRRKERRLSYSRIERFQYVEKYSSMWKNIPICGISLKGWIHHQWNGDVTIIQLYSYKTTTEGNLYYRPKWWIPSKKSLHGEFPRRPCCSIQLRSAWHLLIFLEILQNMSQPSGPTT